MEYLEQIISTTINSFDFAFCIIVNILTYCIIKCISDIFNKKLTIWQKRAILLLAILSTGGVYWVTGSDSKLIINSSILAPVFWSWVMKPICAKLKIDYKPIID